MVLEIVFMTMMRNKMIVYEVDLRSKGIVTCDEASEATYYARKAIESGAKSIFIEVREMSEEEFLRITER